MSVKPMLCATSALATFHLAGLDTPVRAQELMVLDQINVLGERREKRLLETTSSVSIFSEERIEREPGQEINGVIESAPNVNVTSISETPDIRGVEGGGPGGLVNTALSGTQPRVPIIIDEIARPATLQNSDFNSTWDLERVEVFRGPQTTLRGRAASAGAVVVKTKDPTFDPEFAVQFITEADSFQEPTFTVNGLASGGIIDDLLAVRITGEFETGNDPRNLVNVPAGLQDDADELSDFRQTRLRAKALLTPFGADGPLEINAFAEGQFGRIPQTRATVEAPFGDREIEFIGSGLRLFDTEAFTAGLDATYEIGDFGRLRSITGFSFSKFDSVDDQPDPLFFSFREEILSQDLIFEFGEVGDRLSGLVGFNYTRREQDIAIDNSLTPPPVAPNQVLTDGLEQTISGFADFRARLVGGLDLLFGARLLSDNETRRTFSDLLEGPPFMVAPSIDDFEEDEFAFLPSVGLQYSFNEEHSLAFTYRQGRNSGGSAINFFLGTPASFESEDVATYELTYRYDALDGRLTFGATGFFNEFDNPQFFTEAIPGVPFTLQVVNLDDGRSFGAEFEAAAVLTDEIRVHGALGLLETEITGADVNPALVGNDFGNDPRFTISGGIVYEPRFVEGLSFDADSSYTAKYFNSFENDPFEEVAGFALVDFGVSYDRGNFKIRAFLQNALNSDGLTSIAVTDPTSSVGEITPAIAGGIAITARF
ncbi:MAG: TonB-dependent receptor [Pseudomonadota bacterium]